MNGFHPNVNRAVVCAFVAAMVAGGGCRSTSSGVNNPFLAPDRVSPPSTRVLAPGQAQPYYQGDPLPVMQSATAPAPNTLLTNNDAAAARSSSGATLPWNSPTGSAVPPAPNQNPAPVAIIATPSPWGAPPAAQVAYAKESPVAVPTDASELRFALPEPVSPPLAAPIVNAATPATAPTGQPVAPATNQNVALASYNGPATNGLQPVPTPPLLMPTPQAASPWRPPQITPTSPTPMYGMQASPYQAVVAQPVTNVQPAANVMYQTPAGTSANPVAVQLRAVPSPPPQPGDPMPRIRIPGYDVPQTATADGFRPRTAMR